MSLSQTRAFSRHIRTSLLAVMAGPVALALSPAAEAGPALYANSFVVSSSQAACLQNTRQALLRLGIRAADIRQTTFKDDDGRDIPNGWTSDHPSENVSVLFECDARNGMGALAVSGGNNDATYTIYNKLWAIWMR